MGLMFRLLVLCLFHLTAWWYYEEAEHLCHMIKIQIKSMRLGLQSNEFKQDVYDGIPAPIVPDPKRLENQIFKSDQIKNTFEGNPQSENRSENVQPESSEKSKIDIETTISAEESSINIFHTFDTEKLFQLGVYEYDLYPKFKQHFKNIQNKNHEKNHLEVLEGYLQDYEKSSLNATKHIGPNKKIQKAITVSTNPILAYKMIRRFAQAVVYIVKDLEKYPEENKGILTAMQKLNRSGIPTFPVKKDVADAVEGLLKIHLVYDLDLEQFIQGKIGDSKTQAVLSGRDCYDIGKHALRTKKYTLAIRWLEISRRIVFPGDDFTLKALIAKELTSAEILHDREWDKQAGVGSPLGNFMFHKKTSEVKSKDRVEVLKLLREKNAGRRTEMSFWYESLDICKGKNFQTIEEKSKLKCWMDTRTHAYWRINPLKMELLYSNPDLVQIHDFIGDETVKRLKKGSGNEQEKSTVDYDSSKNEYDRTSLNSRIRERIEFATGLKVKHTKAPLVFADYSSSGSHDDVATDTLLEQNHAEIVEERLTTFMLYLNNIEMGGYTAFPSLGTAAQPAKGSAVFWYNVFRNGTADRRMRHSACPVFLGKKQMTINWVLIDEKVQTMYLK